MTKVESLIKLVEKLTGFKSKGTTVCEVIDDLTENCESQSIADYESTFTTTYETTEIPINISSYDKDNDILIVYINRLKAIKDLDYTISDDGLKIILTKSILEGQIVECVVIKHG